MDNPTYAFTFNRNFRLLILFASFFLIPLFVWFGFYLPFEKSGPLSFQLGAVSISTIIILFLLFGLIDVFRHKIEITQNLLTQRTWRKTCTIDIRQIDAVIKLDDNVYLAMKDKVYPKQIKISTHIADLDELISLLGLPLRDVRLEQIASDKSEAISNPYLGASSLQREKTFRGANKTFNFLFFVSIVLLLWALFFSHVGSYFLYSGLIFFPLVLVIAVIYHKDVVCVYAHEDSGVAHVSSTLLICGITLILRAILDFPPFTYAAFLKPAAILAVSIAVMFLPFIRLPKKNKSFAIFILFVLLSGYSVGAVIALNSVWDQKAYRSTPVKVLSKEQARDGLVITFHFKIDSVQNAEGTEVTANVGRTLYFDIKEGEMLEKRQHEGLFNSPWVSFAKLPEKAGH